MPPIYRPDGTEVSRVVLPDGTDASTVTDPDGNVVFDANAIPDGEVYLHDDWGDNKIQNRDGSGTTTYNGVEGLYRPEWTIDFGSPSASNKNLILNPSESISYDASFDVSSQKTTWIFNNVSYGSANDIDYHLGLFSAQRPSSGSKGTPTPNSVSVALGGGDVTDFIRLIYWDSSNGLNEIIRVGSYGSTNNLDIRVERSSTGNYEIFVNGSSEGTGSNSFAQSDYVYFRSNTNSNVDFVVDEMKIK